MPETHVVHALKEKRARLAGELDKAQWVVIRLRSDLAAVDSCLKMFKPGCDPSAIKPKVTLGKNPAGVPKGAGGRLALDVLRETGEAFDCQELARRVLVRLGKEPTPASLRMLGVTIHSTFSRTKKVPVEFDRSTYPGKWRLRPQASQRLAIVRTS
jgi:hypothetical protein